MRCADTKKIRGCHLTASYFFGNIAVNELNHEQDTWAIRAMSEIWCVHSRSVFIIAQVGRCCQQFFSAVCMPLFLSLFGIQTAKSRDVE